MEEQKFKDYKEKQRYYKNINNQTNWFWVSTEGNYDRKNKNNIIKGRTYVKQK